MEKQHNDWSFKIKGILESGRVPVDITDELIHMRPRSADEPAKAILKAIRELKAFDSEGWLAITRLINSTQFYREDIRHALRDRLSFSLASRVPDATEARAAVLVTVLNLGQRFYPSDLLEEADMKREMPWVWESAWKRCGIERYMPAT